MSIGKAAKFWSWPGMLCFLAGVWASGPACVFAAEGSMADSNYTGDEAAIRTIRKASNDAIARQDVKAIVSSLDSEYQITTGAGAFYQGGPQDEMNLWAEHFAEFEDAVYERITDSVKPGSYLPLAAESGHWEGSYTTEQGVRNLSGLYFASWRKVDGEWKIHSELFVTLACAGPGC